MRLPAAFAVVGGIVRHGDKTALRHSLRIQACALLLHCTIGPADNNSWMFFRAVEVLRQIEVSDQSDTQSIIERDLLVNDIRALREGLVPNQRIGGRGRVGRKYKRAQ